MHVCARRAQKQVAELEAEMEALEEEAEQRAGAAASEAATLRDQARSAYHVLPCLPHTRCFWSAVPALPQHPGSVLRSSAPACAQPASALIRQPGREA